MHVATKDIKNFNGLVKGRLKSKLESDYIAGRILTEGDLHCLAYKYIEDSLSKKGRAHMNVHNEYRLLGKFAAPTG